MCVCVFAVRPRYGSLAVYGLVCMLYLLVSVRGSLCFCACVILSTCSHVLSILLIITTTSISSTGETSSTLTSGPPLKRLSLYAHQLGYLEQIQHVPKQMFSALVEFFALYLHLWYVDNNVGHVSSPSLPVSEFSFLINSFRIVAVLPCSSCEAKGPGRFQCCSETGMRQKNRKTSCSGGILSSGGNKLHTYYGITMVTRTKML